MGGGGLAPCRFEGNLTEYCMLVLGLIFLRYAYSRFKFVEADILKDRPVRNGRVLPVEAADFKTKSAILTKNYAILQNDLLRELLRVFNNGAFNEMKNDIIGRTYEYLCKCDSRAEIAELSEGHKGIQHQ